MCMCVFDRLSVGLQVEVEVEVEAATHGQVVNRVR